jgi:hypothetical protein
MGPILRHFGAIAESQKKAKKNLLIKKKKKGATKQMWINDFFKNK